MDSAGFVGSVSVGGRNVITRGRAARRVGRVGLAGRPRSTAVVLRMSATEVAEVAPETEIAIDVTYTSFQGNSWGLKIGEKIILVDPLVEDLQFGSKFIFDQAKPAFGDEKDPRKVLPTPDLILITQSIPDHCHLPTLRQMVRSTRILTTPKAAEMLRADGFTGVQVLSHGSTSEELDGEVIVRAFKGALVGPPWEAPENGFHITVKSIGKSLLFEPHALPEETDYSELQADVLVCPWDRTIVPAAKFVLVAGQTGSAEIAKKVNPSKIILINNKTLPSTGLLTNLIEASGSPEEFRAEMQKNGIDAEIIDPTPRKGFSVF